jgi:transcriptional regulator with XRE-family HTH domain
MNIGKRLRTLREAKGLSQGDIERRSGLLRSYISRVESGYTAPSLPTLEKFAKALEIEPYQLLYESQGRPKSARIPARPNLAKPVLKLGKLYDSMSTSNRKLLLVLASQLAKV